jgi:hypothetical protein
MLSIKGIILDEIDTNASGDIFRIKSYKGITRNKLIKNIETKKISVEKKKLVIFLFFLLKK